MAQLEQQRMKKKEGNINKLKPTSTTVEQGDDNERASQSEYYRCLQPER